MFEIANLLGYAGPLITFGLLGALIVDRYGCRSAIGALLIGALLGAIILGVSGGFHQRAFGGFNLFGTFAAFLALNFLQSANAIAVYLSRRRHASTGAQTAWALLTATIVGLAAALPFGITVGCMVSGECL